jgi:hypothetical protein
VPGATAWPLLLPNFVTVAKFWTSNTTPSNPSRQRSFPAWNPHNARHALHPTRHVAANPAAASLLQAQNDRVVLSPEAHPGAENSKLCRFGAAETARQRQCVVELQILNWFKKKPITPQKNNTLYF